MNAMNLWNDIIKTAVIGTERQTLALTASGDALGNALAQLNNDDREGALLNAAATVALYERAGRLPAMTTQSATALCDAEALPRCNARASLRLALILEEQSRDVLTEWLKALTAGQRVAEERLPALLDAGAGNSDLRAAILPVLGKRGVWLARQNADWDYATGEVDESVWHTGSHAMRVGMLQRMLMQDRAGARRLIAATCG